MNKGLTAMRTLCLLAVSVVSVTPLLLPAQSRDARSADAAASARLSDNERQADSAYRVAMNALNDGNYTQAATLFQRVVDRYSGSSRASSALYYRAFSLYKAGGSSNLSNALGVLQNLHDEYSSAYDRLDASTLRIQICGVRALQGDERCASEVVREADPARQSNTTAARPQQPTSCPREDDENDDRIAALNALLQINSDQALPILERLLANRQSCEVLRKKAVFLVSQKRTDRAADILIDVARNDPSADVREQAIFWLGQSNTERSTDLLAEILQKSTDSQAKEKAIFALSQQRNSRAQQLIRNVAGDDNAASSVREQAIFWLGQRRDPDNSQFLRDLYGRLKNTDLKDKVLFSLSQQRSDDNQKWLLALAMNDREDMELRKQALFWAGQSRGVSIADVAKLYDTVKDREMKEQVIFVLSQKRDTEAVDKLMAIARSDSDKELRSKAIFWLGQSRDPRVVKFLEDLINKSPDR
jgi:HEAT repeat protein